VEQRPNQSAEAEVRDLDAKTLALPPADLAGGGPRPAALVRWGFFVGVGLLLAYGAAQALLSARNLLVLVAMFLAVSLDPAVRWLVATGCPGGLAVAGRQIRCKAQGRWIHESGRRSGRLDHHPRSGSRLSGRSSASALRCGGRRLLG
jgi:hypothetical protein